MTCSAESVNVDLVRRRADVVVVTVGLAVLAIGMAIVGDGRVPAWETDLFRTVNDWPEALYPVMWPFQQLGALVVGPVVAAIALFTGRRRLALAALLATATKLVLERGVKTIVTRERPATSIGFAIEVRGDVHLSGESFVSGHAVLAAALVAVLAPWLPARWRVVAWMAVGVVAVARVYVGAHNPLDMVCGAALGFAIGGSVNLLLGILEPRP
jgi:membrane-associated phospholipid phosphatase